MKVMGIKIETCHLRNIISDIQNSDTWKSQLTITINFVSLKDVEENL